VRRALRLLPIPLGIALALPAIAQQTGSKPESWGLCRVQDAIPAFDTGNGQPAPAAANAEAARQAREQAPTEIEGDTLDGGETQAQYKGDVRLVRGDQFLNADSLDFNQDDQSYVADGHVRYQDSGIRLIAARAEGNQGTDTHRIENVQYQLVNRRGNGGADFIEMAGADGALHGSTYTTCDPDDRHWAMRARRIDFNTDDGWGVAHGATIRVGKRELPVFYFPWAKFPIDDHRQTGLLYPAIANNGRNGFDYRQPIYLNLAPNYDATLEPRIMTRRGIQLGGEFRYLYERGRGEVSGSWIPSDDLVARRRQDYENGEEIRYNDPLKEKNRGSLRFDGSHNVSSQWQARAGLIWISDERYLEDNGNSAYGMAQSILQSQIGLYGQGAYWDAGVMADRQQLADYTLTDGVLPYNRVPRLYFNWEQPFGHTLTLGAKTELVNFQHEDPSRGSGSRLDLKPYVSMPFSGASWYVTPTLAYRYTAYQLSDRLAQSLAGQDQTPNKDPTRSLPIAILDAGLFFERDTEIDDKPYLQTLEPRLFYLNAPYRNQDDLPLFDTRAFTYSWGQLFRDNRYSGPDRQSDANQLTMALSSRLLRQSDGKEKLSVSLGQILYFDDSRVTLCNQSTGYCEREVEQGKSAWVADANYAPTDRWTIGASYQWDPKYRRADLASIRGRYLFRDDGVVNISYRYRRELLEQADLSFLYPINPSWSVVGRYYYSILDQKPLETIAGVQWDSCCMAVRLLARRFVRNREGDLNNAIQFEFVFKGLGSAGQNTDQTLRRAILGYYRDDLYLVPPSNAATGSQTDNSGPDSIL